MTEKTKGNLTSKSINWKLSINPNSKLDLTLPCMISQKIKKALETKNKFIFFVLSH